MTKELAIKILSTRDKYGVPCGYTSGYEEALDMAIEALQRTSNALPTHECVKPTHECVEPVGNSDNIEEMLQRFAQIMRNLEDMKIPSVPEDWTLDT